MSFRLPLRKTKKDSASIRGPAEMLSPRNKSDTATVDSPNNPVKSPRIENDRISRRNLLNYTKKLDSSEAKEIVILLRGSIHDIEVAERVIIAAYSTPSNAVMGARLAAFGGDTEEYALPNPKFDLLGYKILTVKTDVMAKNVEKRSEFIDTDGN